MKTKLVTLLNPTNEQLDHYHGDGNIEDVLTVIFKSNADGTVTISSDLQTTCKKVETAINRYFKAIPENHPLCTYWGNEIADIDAVKESLNETGEFTMHDDEYQIYSVGVELNTIDDDDRSYYMWLNYRTTKEQLKTDFPEIMEELEPSSEAEMEAIEEKINAYWNNVRDTRKRVNEALDKNSITTFPYFAVSMLQRIEGLDPVFQIKAIKELLPDRIERVKHNESCFGPDHGMTQYVKRLLGFIEDWIELTEQAVNEKSE